MPPQRIHLLLALLLISTTAAVGAWEGSMRMPHNNLLMPRQDLCSDSTSKRCDSPAERFCCASSAECIPLNNGTEAICCPAGEDCSFIRTVVCTDSNQQCGSNQCCPVGYDCDSQTTGQPGCKLQERNKPPSYILREQCARLNSQNGGNGGANPTSRTCLDLIAATRESCMEDCPKFPVKAILTGFFPGLAVGALVMFGFGLWMRRRDQRAMKASGGQGASGGDGSVKVGPEGGKVPPGAGRASRKGTVSSGREGRSLHRNNTMGSTEIDIAYDWKTDENYAARGRTGQPGSDGAVQISNNAAAAMGNGIPRVQSPLAYESELKSRQNVIAEEEIQSSGNSMGGYSFRGIAPPPTTTGIHSHSHSHSQPPSIRPASITSSNHRRVQTPSPAPSNTSRKPLPHAPPLPPLPIAELPAMAGVISPTPYSRQASISGNSNHGSGYPHPYTTPPPSTRSPVPKPVATPPPQSGVVPLTQQSLWHHQRQASSSSPPPLMLPPRAQSAYRSSSSSVDSTRIESPSTDDSEREGEVGGAGVGRNTLSPNPPPPGGAGGKGAGRSRARKVRPQSDVVSCITDGDHDDGLTTFAELAAQGHVMIGSAGGVRGMGGVGELEGRGVYEIDGSSVGAAGGGGEERVAVDRRAPPPLPEGYVLGEGGVVRVK